MKLKDILNEGFIEDDFITPEDVLKFKPMINKYKGSIDRMSGTLEWYKKGQDEILMATPSWDGNWGIIPIDYIDSDGDYQSFGKIRHDNKKYAGNKKLQMKDYVDTIRRSLKHLDSEVEKNWKQSMRDNNPKNTQGVCSEPR